MLWKVRALYSDGPSLMRAVILSPFLSVAGKLCGSVLTGAGRGGGGWGLPPSVHRPAHVGTAQVGGVKVWLTCLSIPSEMHVDVDWLMFSSNGEVSSKQNIYERPCRC